MLSSKWLQVLCYFSNLKKWERNSKTIRWPLKLVSTIAGFPPRLYNTRFIFISNAFLTQLYCCLTFSRIELQMMLRCCLIHITVIILKYTLYLVYLGPFLVPGLFMSYLWVYVSLIFSLILVTINHITSLKPFNVCCLRKKSYIHSMLYH